MEQARKQQVVARGRVRSINVSKRKGTRKTPCEGGATVVAHRGLDTDAHAGDWHRQVSLLAWESIEKARATGLDVVEGDFAENVTTEGIDLLALPLGTRVRIGEDVLLELSQIGKVCHTKTIRVKVPAGIDDGQTLRVRGEGNTGLNGGPSGDLMVTVSVRSHPLFTRQGQDVYCEMPITFTQAACGAEVEVPTLDGKVRYTIGEGTQTGTTFRMRGKGIQNVNGRGRGDQYVRVNIEVPKNLSDKQKKLLREFEETSTDENQVKRKSFWDKVKDALKDK